MLKHIPKILSPDLMKILLEMGHSDEIVIADGNFPANTCAKRLIRCDGHGVVEVLSAILKFFPLDSYSEHSVSLMQVVPGDTIKPTIWEEYKSIVKKLEPIGSEFEFVERFEFYARAKNAYAVVATSEAALYANIILKKGVV
jgi:L-fucose mutarotase